MIRQMKKKYFWTSKQRVKGCVRRIKKENTKTSQIQMKIVPKKGEMERERNVTQNWTSRWRERERVIVCEREERARNKRDP